MVTDRGRSYEGSVEAAEMSGPLRSISEVVETKRGRGRSFGNRLSRLLREAMERRSGIWTLPPRPSG